MPRHDSSTTNTTPISRASIPILLEWWQRRKRTVSVRTHLGTTRCKDDEAYLKAYYRLMEVYSVVKAGGVQVQTEAVQAFAKRESELLNQKLYQIEAAPALPAAERRQEREKIQREIQELCSANRWRLEALARIAPAEEELVKQYLPDIEKTLLQVQCV